MNIKQLWSSWQRLPLVFHLTYVVFFTACLIWTVCHYHFINDNAILVLFNNTINTPYLPKPGNLFLLTSKNKNHKVKITFEKDTDLLASCSVIHRNKPFIFGGDGEKRQIGTLDDCLLKRIGSLSFDFAYGACTSAKHFIVLCFDLGYSLVLNFITQ